MNQEKEICPQCKNSDIVILCGSCLCNACHKCSFVCPKCNKAICYNCESCSCDDECVIHQFENGICFYCNYKCEHKIDKNGFCIECLEFISRKSS
jgi:hypothetical protein